MPPTRHRGYATCTSQSDTCRLAKEITDTDLTNHQDLLPAVTPDRAIHRHELSTNVPGARNAPRSTDRDPSTLPHVPTG